MKPTYFKDQAAFRKWLKANHDKTTELLVGFHKKDSGKKSITYPEALDEALCFGWIDGVRRRVDETSYTIRFTPRKPKSIWSLINVGHVERLTKAGLMMPAGVAAYKKRDPKRTGTYSFENQPVEFSEEFLKEFRANKKAWDFFSKQPAFLVKTVKYWVMSAKKEETRQRRMKYLIERSAEGTRLGVLVPKK
jgi:uncharacterized protein YdeI (YjbR/CyaY-like superfamily)